MISLYVDIDSGKINSGNKAEWNKSGETSPVNTKEAINKHYKTHKYYKDVPFRIQSCPFQSTQSVFSGSHLQLNYSCGILCRAEP